MTQKRVFDVYQKEKEEKKKSEFFRRFFRRKFFKDQESSEIDLNLNIPSFEDYFPINSNEKMYIHPGEEEFFLAEYKEREIYSFEKIRETLKRITSDNGTYIGDLQKKSVCKLASLSKHIFNII